MLKYVKKWMISLAIVAGGVGIFFGLKATAPVVTPDTKVEKTWTVRSQLMKVEDNRPTIFEFGTIVAGNKAELRPLVPGRITKVGKNFVEGAIIRAEDPVVTIDSFDYQIEVADRRAARREVLANMTETQDEIDSEVRLMAIAKSQLELRETNLNRRRNLVKRGSGSQKSLDDAKIAYNDAARSLALRGQTISRLKNRLKRYKASSARAKKSLELAERNLEETELFAPFDGFLVGVDASVGQQVTGADRLGQLIEAERLEVRFRLSQRDLIGFINTSGKVKENSTLSSEFMGKLITINWEVAGQNLEFRARIERRGAEIDPTSGGLDVFARILNIGLDTPLRPGAFVKVIIPDRKYERVVLIPDTAIVEENNIYVIEDGRLAKQRVEVVQRRNDWVLIRGQALNEKEVLTRPFPEMSAGIRVKSR